MYGNRMYDEYQDAVEIKFYYDFNREEGNDYYIVPLCDGCAAERGGDIGEAGDPDPGTAWHCEDCKSLNRAELRLEEEEEI